MRGVCKICAPLQREEGFRPVQIIASKAEGVENRGVRVGAFRLPFLFAIRLKDEDRKVHINVILTPFDVIYSPFND